MKRNITLACGGSASATFWTNRVFSWEELCERLQTPRRTRESAAEYEKMTREEKARAKDIGGFVGGALKDNRRKRENVAFRSLLTLDADKAEPGFIESFAENCPVAALLYTTHSHTPQHPRCRILVPLTRDVTPEEYTALARNFAAGWGMEAFDECSYQPQQMMYWPGASSDGEYICRVTEGPWLDPEAIPAQHPGKQDAPLLPPSSREKERGPSAGKQQQDPRTKPGVVGAFCRVYGIGAAIEKFLPDIYTPSATEGRYDYIPADSAAGLVVYEDTYAFSHHATDPAHGRLLHAFDLVKLHRFGEENPKEAFRKMKALAMEEEAVMAELARGNREPPPEEADWHKKLTFDTRTGKPENSVVNLHLILENDPEIRNFAFNEMAGLVQVTGPLPWGRPEENHFWRDADTAQLKIWVGAHYIPFSDRHYDTAFAKAADDRRFHPLRKYLASLPPWDGEKRVEDLFIKYLEAEDTPYVRAVTRKTFAAAVARILRPGTKFDCVPVLDGEQGIGKSTIVKDLVTPEYYSETLSLTDMNDKSGSEKLQGIWVAEIAELAGMRKADIEKVKSFLSATDDKYRASYGHAVESHPRQCILLGTVNGERGYLRDITGNRRFWIIKLNRRKQKKAWNFTEEFRAQFWAEAKALWEGGEKLFLEGELLAVAEKAQHEAMEQDDRTGMVEEYLATLLPENWETMDLYARLDFLSGKRPGVVGTIKRTVVSNAEIWCECFGRNLSELRSSDSYAIAAIMAQTEGWKRSKITKRMPNYGKQRLYERKEEEPNA